MAKRNDWYTANIEAPIRKVVKLLRDNGFNTTASCGHEMVVEMEFSYNNELERLWDVLYKNNIKEFDIRILVQKRSQYWRRVMELILPRPDGTYMQPMTFDRTKRQMNNG